MDKHDIFDLEDLSDLSYDFLNKSNLFAKAGRSINGGISLYDRIKMLFSDKDIISVDQIIVGLYRKYKISYRRSYVLGILQRLIHQRFLKKNRKPLTKDTYEKC